MNTADLLYSNPKCLGCSRMHCYYSTINLNDNGLLCPCQTCLVKTMCKTSCQKRIDFSFFVEGFLNEYRKEYFPVSAFNKRMEM